ncbi:MAG: hypothetical protein HYR91_01725 [Flavobacteriia bacterium]|nr:hypothetical protein [Flavobacteriia bacterium]
MNDLIAQFSDNDFVIQTQRQISKDFAKFGYHFVDEFEKIAWTKTAIELAIQEILIVIIKHGESKLLPLIYTIDIAEHRFLKLSQDSDFIIRLSEEILKREALKVYIRRNY